MSEPPASRTAMPVDEAAATLRGVGQRGRLAPTSGAQVVAAWEALVAAGGPADAVREQVPSVVRALRHGKALDDARRLAEAALSGDLPNESRAMTRLELATVRLSQGEPVPDLAEAVRAALVCIDQRVRSGRIESAARLVVQVNEAVFHRELHGEVDTSPLVFQPEQFLAPLRESLTYQALTAPCGAFADAVAMPAPEGRQRGFMRGLLSADRPVGRRLRSILGRPVPPRLPPKASSGTSFPAASVSSRPDAANADGPQRILVISGGNLHFTRGLLADLEASGEVDVRVVELRSSGYPRRGHPEMIADRLADACGGHVPSLPPAAAAELDRADTIFVDWCDVAAQWAVLHAPAGARVIVRVHSLEAISAQPHMIDWSKVSDLIFVGGHVRDLFLTVVPSAAAVDRTHLVPNEMRLERFGRPKTEAAARTVAMIGWAQAVKDPLWALDMLAHLRASDPRWRLMLIGRDFAESQIASGYAYRDAFRARVEHDDVRDGVVDVGYTTDLPGVLRDAGYVVCSSRREGAPVGVTEAAASGAVPVIRDWPMAAPYGGARRVFPADWVVDDPAAAAQRILALDGAERDQAGAAARQHALANFDWAVVGPQYRAIFLDER